MPENSPEVRPAWTLPRGDPEAYRKQQAEAERKFVESMGEALLRHVPSSIQARCAAKAVVIMLTRMLPGIEPMVQFSVDILGGVTLSWQVRGEVKKNGYVVAFDTMTIDQHGGLGPIYRTTREVTHGQDDARADSCPVVDSERPAGHGGD